MRYPVADRSEWYGEANYETNGGIIVMMDPSLYLSSVRPLRMDEESLEGIQILACHILEGQTLDPLVIYPDGKEDGRHRAHAAVRLGIEEVPVILFGPQIERFADLVVEDGPSP